MMPIGRNLAMVRGEKIRCAYCQREVPLTSPRQYKTCGALPCKAQAARDYKRERRAK